LNQPRTVDEVDELRRELHELRDANAKLDGELAAALKVEVATSRFADNLEARLDEARRQHESELGKPQRELGRQAAPSSSCASGPPGPS
jgi:chromosome segregation ATPase